jgi:hypothetical protein
MFVVVILIDDDDHDEVYPVYGPFDTQEAATIWAMSADITADNDYQVRKVRPV